MKKVTRQEFFTALHAEEAKGKDIMPAIVSSTFPYVSDWTEHTKPGRPVFGRTHNEEYFLVAPNAVSIKPFRSTETYDYVTTEAGRNCTARKGIGCGILVNVSAIDADGVADIWTESAITGPYTDQVAFNTLKLREVA